MTPRRLVALAFPLLFACSGGDFSVGMAAPDDGAPEDIDPAGDVGEDAAIEADASAPETFDQPETAVDSGGADLAPSDTYTYVAVDTASEATLDSGIADTWAADTHPPDAGTDTRTDSGPVDTGTADTGAADTYVAPDSTPDAPWQKCQKCGGGGPGALCPSLAAEQTCFSACGAGCAFDTYGRCYCN